MNIQSKTPTALLQWSCLALLLGSIILVALAGGWLLTKGAPRPSGPRPTAIVWTATPTPTPTATPTSTPLPTPTLPLSPEEVGVGVQVSVIGTGAAGLSIRATASTTAERLHIAAEGERFLVIDGPTSAEDFIWWQVRHIARPEQQGWVVQDYLQVEP